MTSPAHPARLLTVGRLAKLTGLARASLLHYESLGLLQPAARSQAGYRLYGAGEVERVRWIRRYREAGLPLASIAELLAASGSASPPRAPALLEARLLALSAEVERLRTQQQVLARLLAERAALGTVRGKADWVALLGRAGFDDAAMWRWHATFEAENPSQHAAFLRALGLGAGEVAAIRRRAANATQTTN